MYFTIISVCTVDENQPVINFQSRTKSLDRREMKPLKANKGKEKDMLIEQVWTTCAIIGCIIIENSCCTILSLLIYYCYTHTHTHTQWQTRSVMQNIFVMDCQLSCLINLKRTECNLKNYSIKSFL